MVMFVRSDRTDILQRLSAQVSPAQSFPLSVVHPRMYQDLVDQLQLVSRRADLEQRPFPELVAAIGPSALRAIRRRLTKGWQTVVEVRRRPMGGEAPAWHSATTEHIGHI
jgi:hypothetical protein